MIDRNVLLEKMQTLGVDWLGSSGFLDEDQVKHILDIVENESGLKTRALERANVCRVIEHFYIDGICAECGSPEPPRQ